MRPDLAAPLGREAAVALRGAVLSSGPLFIVPRRLQGGIAAALDGLEPDSLPRLRFEGAPRDLGAQLRRAVADRVAGPRWLVNWLVRDVLDLAELAAGLTDARAIRLRLDAIDDDRCPRFHVDDVRFRLVTTYRGPGTEWISPRLAAVSAEDGRVPPDAVRRLERGEVAVMRGGRGATPERPGLLHRSPPIAGTGIVRLFLAVDEIERRLH